VRQVGYLKRSVLRLRMNGAIPQLRTPHLHVMEWDSFTFAIVTLSARRRLLSSAPCKFISGA